MADIDPTSPGDTDVVATFPANERASRNALLQLTGGDAFGGGTSGGSANEQTVTIANTGLTLRAGLTFTFIAGFSLTSATATLQVNALAATQLALPNGSTAVWTSTAGPAVVAGNRYLAVYDGTNIVIMNPSNYRDQGEYDDDHPVGDTVFRRTTTAPIVPLGVTATWTRTTTEAFVRVEGTTPTTGGAASFSTAATALTEAQLPAHYHHVMRATAAADTSPSDLDADNFLGWENSASANRGYVAASVLSGTFVGRSGTVGSGSGHTHSVDTSNILHRSYAVWERTA